MTRNHFWQGMGLGLLAGATLGLTMSPGKRTVRLKASQARRAVEDAVDNITEAMGL